MVAWCFIRFYPISRSWGVSPKKTSVEGCPDIATGGMVKGNPIAVMETSMGEIEAEYLGGKSHQTKSLLSPSGLILQHLAVEKPWPDDPEGPDLCAGFLKYGYPKSSIFMGISIINQPFLIPPIYGDPLC